MLYNEFFFFFENRSWVGLIGSYAFTQRHTLLLLLHCSFSGTSRAKPTTTYHRLVLRFALLFFGITDNYWWWILSIHPNLSRLFTDIVGGKIKRKYGIFIYMFWIYCIRIFIRRVKPVTILICVDVFHGRHAMYIQNHMSGNKQRYPYSMCVLLPYLSVNHSPGYQLNKMKLLIFDAEEVSFDVAI